MNTVLFHMGNNPKITLSQMLEKKQQLKFWKLCCANQMFFMGFLKPTVPVDTGWGQKQMNCLSEVILVPDSRSDCLGLEIWFRHNSGNTTT